MKIIGLGESSIRKSYYPELQQRIGELEEKTRELEAAYADQTAASQELRRQIDENTVKEQELRKSEERFRSLIDASPVRSSFPGTGSSCMSTRHSARWPVMIARTESWDETSWSLLLPNTGRKWPGTSVPGAGRPAECPL